MFAVAGEPTGVEQPSQILWQCLSGLSDVTGHIARVEKAIGPRNDAFVRPKGSSDLIHSLGMVQEAHENSPMVRGS